MADDKVQEQPQAEKTQAKKGGKKGKEKAEVEVVRLGPPNVDYSKDNVFGVAHIYASFNDTFVVCFFFFCWLFMTKILFNNNNNNNIGSKNVILQHITDLSGKETVIRVTGKQTKLISVILNAVC